MPWAPCPTSTLPAQTKTTTNKMSLQKPILVVGAGLAGLSLARSLASYGVPAIVFDGAPETRRQGFGIMLRNWGYGPLLELSQREGSRFSRGHCNRCSHRWVWFSLYYHIRRLHWTSFDQHDTRIRYCHSRVLSIESIPLKRVFDPRRDIPWKQTQCSIWAQAEVL